MDDLIWYIKWVTSISAWQLDWIHLFACRRHTRAPRQILHPVPKSWRRTSKRCHHHPQHRLASNDQYVGWSPNKLSCKEQTIIVTSQNSNHSESAWSKNRLDNLLWLSGQACSRLTQELLANTTMLGVLHEPSRWIFLYYLHAKQLLRLHATTIQLRSRLENPWAHSSTGATLQHQPVSRFVMPQVHLQSYGKLIKFTYRCEKS